jgi:hypothetical protein
MPGLKARILRRRPDGAPPPALSDQDGAPADQPTVVVPANGAESSAPAEPVPAAEPVPPAEPATAVHEPAPAGAEAAEALPAATEPETPARPDFRSRGRLRRRLRYLRRVRELGFRDLGGLVFDLDRFGRERTDLVRAKLDALTAIDRELRSLEQALDDVRPIEELHEPGISACTHCGSLHGSEARYCPACGIAVGTPLPPPAMTQEPAPVITPPAVTAAADGSPVTEPAATATDAPPAPEPPPA